MSKFTTPLKVLVLDDYKFQLTEGFEYYVGDIESKEIIKVPRGFTTDFASVPRIFWTILPPHGKYAKAAVIHDWMYCNGYKSKDYADKVFYEAMLVLGVPKFKAKLMYQFVKYIGNGNY